jgi:SprT protein
VAKVLTLQELEGLLAIAPPEISDAVNRKVQETIETFVTKLGGDTTISTPQIKYDLKGHHAGWAIGGHTIRLNIDLLLNPTTRDHILNITVPHEVAHIVVQQLWPHSPGGHHGYKWQAMMFILGLPPDRTHSLQTTAARKRTKPHLLYCNCGEHWVSVTIYRRFVQGTKYRCRKCNVKLRKARDS